MENKLGSLPVPLEPRFLIDDHRQVDIFYPAHSNVNERLLTLIYPKWVDFVEGDFPKVEALLTVARDMATFAVEQTQSRNTGILKRDEVEKYIENEMGGWQDGMKSFISLWLSTMKSIPTMSDLDPVSFGAKFKYDQLLPKYELAKELLTQKS